MKIRKHKEGKFVVSGVSAFIHSVSFIKKNELNFCPVLGNRLRAAHKAIKSNSSSTATA
jgi:hypothetical protein